MAQPEAEARRALKGLFAASGPRTPPSGSEAMSGERAAAREQAGTALRELFKSDFRKAMPSPVAVDTWKEVERQVFKSLESLEQVAAPGSFKPPPRQRSAKATNGVSVEVQTVVVPQLPRHVEEPVYEPPPVPRTIPMMRKCVELEPPRIVEPWRKKVIEAQRRISSLDSETTRLTKALKKSRIEIWEHQREHCAVDKEIDRILAEHAGDIPATGWAEFAKIVQEEASCNAELKVEREKANTVKQHVRHQDKMLQQEREATKGEVHRILQRHPCGEVFLPPMSSMVDSDDDSDDDYCRYGGREPARRPPPRSSDRVQLGSSDEDEDDYNTRRPPTAAVTGGEGPPPPPSQGFRVTTEDDEQSEGRSASSVTSPTSSGPSPSNARLASGLAAPKLRADASESSCSSGDEPDKAANGNSSLKQAAGEKALATSMDSDEGSKRTSPSQGQQSLPRQGVSVPPLPELSGLSRETATAANADEAEEVSSEEDWDDESGGGSAGGSSRSV